MSIKYECEGQLDIFDLLEDEELDEPDEPIDSLPIGTTIGRVILGEVQITKITAVEGNSRHFYYRTELGVCYNPKDAETDIDKLNRIAEENRKNYKTIEDYPLENRVTICHPASGFYVHDRYGQVGIFKNMLYWKDDCTYEFLIPYKSERKLKREYKKELKRITGTDGFNSWKKKAIPMKHQLPMTRLYWSKEGFYASAEYVKNNG